MYDREHFFAAIIGGGPAGAQCALWLKNMGIPAILFEKENHLGGLQRTAPDPLTNHYVVTSSGMRSSEISKAIQENLNRHGAPYVCGARVNEITDDGEWFKLSATTESGTHHVFAKYIVLASGVEQRANQFKASNTVFIGTSDPRVRSGKFFDGKSVAILGGGDNAFECHGFVKQQGAKVAHIFARSLRAGPNFIASVPAEDVNVGGYNVHVAADDSVMGHCLTYSDDPFSRNFYEFIIVNYGFESRRVLPESFDPARDERGFIRADADCRTNIDRILAIGEASQRMHPCVATSMADGVIASKTLESLFIEDQKKA